MKPNIYELLEHYIDYSKDFEAGLKFYILMFLLTKNNLTRMWAYTNRAEANSFFIKQLRTFNYKEFAEVTTLIPHSPERCAKIVDEVMQELSNVNSKIIRDL